VTRIDDVRRTLLAKAIPYLVSAYWEVGARVSPAAVLTRIVEEFEDVREQMGVERDRLQSVVSDLDRLNPAFQNGKLAFDLDRTTALDLIATFLKKSFVKEGGTAGTFRILPAQLAKGRHYDAELKLPDRSVYTRLLFRDLGEDEMSSYLEEAHRAAPSEYWVFSFKEDSLDFRLQPVFVSENKVIFGRLRYLPLMRLLEEMLGKHYRLSATQKGDRPKIILERCAG
jgi:hypothetical protein